MHGSSGPGGVSFLVPVHDEIGSLPVLAEEIRRAAEDLDWEAVFVDDGSGDGSGAWLDAAAEKDARFRALHLPERRGQSAALAAGIAVCRKPVIVTIDADLQNDPADVPRLLEALEGSDLACGVRACRRDSWGKRVGSRIGNGVRRLVLGDRFRDVGCSLKAWRREVALAVPKFTGFHRFVPVLAEAAGFRVVEIEVNHRPRVHGRTHYGNLGRAWRGLFDLLGVRWLLRRRVVVSGVAEGAA